MFNFNLPPTNLPSLPGSAQLATLLTKAGYRRDLVQLAQAKYARCLKSLKKAKTQTMTKRRAAKAVVAAPEEEVN